MFPFETEILSYVLAFLGWAIIFGALIYIPFRRSTAAAQGWLLLFFFLPWMGLVIYLAVGNSTHPKWRRERIAEVPSIIRKAIGDIPPGGHHDVEGLSRHHRMTADLVRRIGGFPALRGNSVAFDADYNRVVDRIAGDIDAARDHAHVMVYILQNDQAGKRILSALERAARRGVKCRLLIDAVGSSRDRKAIAQRLEGSGVEMHLILPLRFWNRATRLDLRNHRKIVVVDGHTGWVGSQNMHRIEYEPKTFYRELMARVEGPVVSELQAIFVGDWYLETNEDIGSRALMPPLAERVAAGSGEGSRAQVLPSGPDYPDAGIDVVFTDLIYSARETVVLATPYFIPNEPLLLALRTAVSKGVKVTLYVTSTTNSFLIDRAQQSYFEELLYSGVEIMLYRERFLHAKHLSIDDEVAVIGSANMDRRSFELNSEVTLLVYDRGVVEDLRRIERDYRGKSRSLRFEDWERRGFWRKLAENVTRLISPLL